MTEMKCFGGVEKCERMVTICEEADAEDALCDFCQLPEDVQRQIIEECEKDWLENEGNEV